MSTFTESVRAITRPVTRPIALGFLRICRHNVEVDLRETRAELERMIEAKRTDGPYAPDHLDGEIWNLEQREDALAEELAYVQFKLDSLNEKDACDCHRVEGRKAA